MLENKRLLAPRSRIWLPVAILASIGIGFILAQSRAAAFYGFQDQDSPGNKTQAETRQQLPDQQDEDAAERAELLRQESEEKRQEEEKKTVEQALLLRHRDEAQIRTTWNRPEHVAGNMQCIDCHRQETRSWLASKHSTRAFDLLRTSNALDYAKKLGIRPIDITRSSLCINCHGTPVTKINGNPDVFAGVSCESCHGSSLGENGWLNIHAVYGGAHTMREQETPDHYNYRQKRCDDAGRLQSSNLYGLTKRCFNCHVVGDEALAEAGHSQGDRFEMVNKALGEVRHNFILDENVNSKIATLWQDPFRHGNTRTVDGRLRVMFVLGQMVDLEVSLRGLARATGVNDFSDALIDRIDEANEWLAEEIVEAVEDIDEEAAETEAAETESSQESEASDPSRRKTAIRRERPELAEIRLVVNIVAPLWEKLDDDGFDEAATVEYGAAANSIAEVAKKFSRRDGNDLQVLDQLELLPDDFFDGAFDPNPKSETDTGEERIEK